jgi:hypothetical protein
MSLQNHITGNALATPPCCIAKYSLFIVRFAGNKFHSVGKTRSSSMLKQVLHTITTVADFCRSSALTSVFGVRIFRTKEHLPVGTETADTRGRSRYRSRVTPSSQSLQQVLRLSENTAPGIFAP